MNYLMTTELQRLGMSRKVLEKLSSIGIATVEDLAFKRLDDQEGRLVFREKEWKKMVLSARHVLSRKIMPKLTFEESQTGDLIVKNGVLADCYVMLSLVGLTEENVDILQVADGSLCVKAKRFEDEKLQEYNKAVFNNAKFKLKEYLRNAQNQKQLDTIQAIVEARLIQRQEAVFDSYLKELVENRLEETIEFGKRFSLRELAEYLKKLTGELYEDALLVFAQQYGMSDTVVVKSGSEKFTSGFNLAFFGAPGTGKSYASVDLIVGNELEKIPAHGLPGYNRYCGGMTASQFIRIAQAYEGKRFTFIVPEFNEWFKYPGMVEILKQAMERKTLRYETTKFSISPYSFDSFFSVSYNTKIFDTGKYTVTISDPNYKAIEDRMLCRLHTMTKQRFNIILDNMEKQFLSEREYEPRKFRDHLTLVYAIQTHKPLVAEYFSPKQIELSESLVRSLISLAKRIADESNNYLDFSPRLLKRLLQVAAAMSLIKFFGSESTRIIMDDDTCEFTKRLFAEEVNVRLRQSYL